MTSDSSARPRSACSFSIVSRTHRRLGVDTVLITGIATNICCDTTAREAAQRDFHVYFVADATSTFDMQGVAGADLYAATCASLAQVFADVVTIDDILQAFSVARQLAGARR